jgi:hypothetical protein
MTTIIGIMTTSCYRYLLYTVRLYFLEQILSKLDKCTSAATASLGPVFDFAAIALTQAQTNNALRADKRRQPFLCWRVTMLARPLRTSAASRAARRGLPILHSRLYQSTDLSDKPFYITTPIFYPNAGMHARLHDCRGSSDMFLLYSTPYRPFALTVYR